MIHEIVHYSILSVAGAAALMVMSKIILNKLIRRDTDYYEKVEAKEEAELLNKAAINDKHIERSSKDDHK